MSSLTFDLHKLTAREIKPYLARMATGQVGCIIEIAPRIVTECPLCEPDKP